MQRFQTLSQACGFVTGQLTGLAYSSRYDGFQLPQQVRSELMEMAKTLTDAVQETEKAIVKKKKEHSTK